MLDKSRESLIKYIRSERDKQLLDNHTSYGVDLSNSDLSGLDLRDLDLRKINFTNANFEKCFLADCDLSDSDLTRANFNSAVLNNAKLHGARLFETDFSFAALFGTNFTYADIHFADFKCAQIADNTIFTNASIYEPKHMLFIPMACPDSEFIAWKKCLYNPGDGVHACIVKLLIPEDAKRSSATGRKCRASKAKVLDIQTIGGDSLGNVTAWSMHENSFVYKIGRIVEPSKPFDENRWKECASGIHFFITRQEAVKY
jgi:uncharacterized protein YjbI with pentapeptide repeats